LGVVGGSWGKQQEEIAKKYKIKIYENKTQLLIIH
jgi:hypothetical protein